MFKAENDVRESMLQRIYSMIKQVDVSAGITEVQIGDELTEDDIERLEIDWRSLPGSAY